MLRIQLKPNSPEFADDEEKVIHRCCDMPSCKVEGDYRAPKDRELSEYYWFCLEHVADYNKAWNYFTGMTSAQVEEFIVRSALWDRPTQKFSDYKNLEEKLYRKTWQTYNHTNKDHPKNDKTTRPFMDRNTQEFQAMALMGLEPPLDLEKIKKRYKTLVKKYHPDINREDPDAEELLKSINMAYTVLKLAFKKFAELDPEEK